MLRDLILLSVAGFVILVGGFTTLLVILVALGGESHGTRLEFNGGEVFYTDAVREAEAQALGEFLVEGEFFDGSRTSVQLDRRDETVLVRFALTDGTCDDADIQAAYSKLQTQLSLFVFDGGPVEIHLCNEMMDTQYVISAVAENSLPNLVDDLDENS